MSGKEIYKRYEAIYLEHIGESTDEMSSEVKYARFIYGLTEGFSCFKAFTYEEVYAKLEEAERTGKKLVLRDSRHNDANNNDIIIISTFDDADDDAFMEIYLE